MADTKPKPAVKVTPPTGPEGWAEMRKYDRQPLPFSLTDLWNQIWSRSSQAVPEPKLAVSHGGPKPAVSHGAAAPKAAAAPPQTKKPSDWWNQSMSAAEATKPRQGAPISASMAKRGSPDAWEGEGYGAAPPRPAPPKLPTGGGLGALSVPEAPSTSGMIPGEGFPVEKTVVTKTPQGVHQVVSSFRPSPYQPMTPPSDFLGGDIQRPEDLEALFGGGEEDLDIAPPLHQDPMELLPLALREDPRIASPQMAQKRNRFKALMRAIVGGRRS